MKFSSFIWASCIVMLWAGCTNSTSTQATKSESNEITFSALSWNIWHGGLHGPKEDKFQKDSMHTENVLKVLNEADADVVFMQETYCCGMEIAQKAGYKYQWRGSSNLSIHSRYPIVDTFHIFKPFNSHAAIINVDGQEILLVNIWLHYLPDFFNDIKSYSSDSLVAGEEKTRLSEIRQILSAVDSLTQTLVDIPILIAGDFNSGSHLDWGAATKAFHYGKQVMWPVSKSMMDDGFVDSYRQVHPNVSPLEEGTWGFLSDEIIADRIDFIYSFGDQIQAVDSKIIMDDPADGFFNSDHRAVWTKFVFRQDD